ncbi:Crp/Fnr family transcriptional regulator [Bacteroidales bacterium OttesenSCG-928-K03]|nr:Crp/Fnr family transcriptional regulator [Odoribacter sp. OttesenSCG-928-L07]MDL2242315.1 Crp/Fnr family transcriptional regulator [Bacteroidales bacterium OttesenSCG-928-K03]
MNRKDLIITIPLINLGARCFEDLPDEILNELKLHKRRMKFKAGETLFKQGTFTSAIMLVIDGFVKEYMENDSGKNTNLRIATTGDFLSLSGVFFPGSYHFTAEALNDCTICVFENDYLRKLAGENASFGLRLMERFGRTESTYFSVLNSMLYKQMNGKIAKVLLYLSSFPEIDGASVYDFLSRKDIADFAIVTPENATRVIKSFEADGLIKLEDKRIIILDYLALEKIKELG